MRVIGAQLHFPLLKHKEECTRPFSYRRRAVVPTKQPLTVETRRTQWLGFMNKRLAVHGSLPFFPFVSVLEWKQGWKRAGSSAESRYERSVCHLACISCTCHRAFSLSNAGHVSCTCTCLTIFV